MISMNASAYPRVLNLGADDKSTKILYPTPEPIPQHLPLFYFFAEKGKEGRVLADQVGKLPLLYGTKTFDPDSKFFKHTTRFLMSVVGQGNTCMLQRVVPDDAGIRASAIVYVDVLKTTIPNYLRDSLGNYIPDPVTNGYKVDAGKPTIVGHKIKFIQEYHKGSVEVDLGLLKPKTGTMSDGDITSTMYPLFEAKAKEKGSAYNNYGFMISSLFNKDVDTTILSKTKGLSYRLSLVTREDLDSTPTIFRTLAGEPYVQFSLQEKIKNPNTESRFDFEQIFKTSFFNEKNPIQPLKYFDYENIYLYRNNLEYIYKALMTEELKELSSDIKEWEDGELASNISWFDYTTEKEEDIFNKELYMLNIFTCKSSNNVDYLTFRLSKDIANLAAGQKEVAITKDFPIWLQNGSDGTCDLTNLDNLVMRDMVKYIDEDSEYHDTAINVESILYDSGFGLECKKSLFNFIALRKDTVVVLATHEAKHGEKYLPTSENKQVGVLLKNRAKLAPESEYFGTQTARALIVMSNGVLRDGSSADRIPATYELAIKAAKMMGAGDGKWNMEARFDSDPGNRIKELVDIQPEFIAEGFKPTLWADGLIWAQPADRADYAFLQLQTVYDNDTSVLNSFFNVMALATINKIGQDAWRKHAGTTGVTPDQFLETVNGYCKKQLADRFGTMISTIPIATIEPEDDARGYSWRLTIKMGGEIMKTAMTYVTEVYRRSDLFANEN